MKRIYVCSPFRGQTGSAVEIDANVQHAREACKWVAEQGDCPIAPHLLFTQFLDDTDVAQRERGISCALSLLVLCDAVYVCARIEGEISLGMRAEIAEARAVGLPRLLMVRRYNRATSRLEWTTIAV